MSNQHVDRILLKDELECLGIEEVVRYYSPKIRTRGRLVLFLCPFHDDTNLGAATAYSEKNDFCCHACGVGGSIDKLAVQFAKKMHPQDAHNFDAILEHIVEDLNIPKSSVVRGDWKGGEQTKREVVDETLYFNLFGSPYIMLEKEFAPVTMPNKKAMRVPTNVEKIYFKTLFIRDKKLHDRIVLVKARSIFQTEIEKEGVDAEALMEKQLLLLKKILRVSSLPEEEEFRKNVLARKRVIDNFIARKKGTQ